MNRAAGFSTGAIAKSDFRSAWQEMEQAGGSDAIELSALRESELQDVVDFATHLPTNGYRYRSIHAPKSFEQWSEQDAVALLTPLANLGFKIILHPDAIRHPELWRKLGSALCIENMDTRKRTGRTARELSAVFDDLPDAGLCLDLGHARQVDPTMTEAVVMLTTFKDRLTQLHVSEVDTDGGHRRMSQPCRYVFQSVAHLIDPAVPVIIESPVRGEAMVGERANALAMLTPAVAGEAAH